MFPRSWRRSRAGLGAVLLLLCGTNPAAAQVARPGESITCSIASLPGLSVQYARVLRNGEPPAGLLTDFWRVADAVVGSAAGHAADVVHDGAGNGVGGPSLPDFPCDTGVRARDRVAWSMGLGGYSAREIADVLKGHLTRADIDAALSRLMAGQPRPVVAAFLEARWRESGPATPPAVQSPSRLALTLLPGLDAELSALARQHGIAPGLVRAVIAAESGGDPRAVSPAGAIGLMQLMPPTAAALGVDPWQPIENLRGGVRYLAGLMRAYGEDTRLALIAYNAGPQHADRVRAGHAVAYRETRRYLDTIAAYYPVP